MSSLYGGILLISSTLVLSYCRGREVHYKDGKVLELESEQEYEKGAQYKNRLDFYESKFDGKKFIISKDGLLKVDNAKIKLPEKIFKYTDFYSLTKVNGKYFVRMGFDDGVDIFVLHLVEIDLEKKKFVSVWTEPCGHWRTYFSLLEKKLTYMCEYYCDKASEGKRNSFYQYSQNKWSIKKNGKYCKDFGKHKEIGFTSFEKILIKKKSE